MRNFLDAIHNKWRWPLILLLIIILILNSKFNINLDDYSFKTPEENINQFIVKTEGLGPSTMGEAKSGNALYDENRILGENLYKMGDAKYLVYVHGGSDYAKVERVVNLEKAIAAYTVQKEAIPLYSIETKDLIGTTNEIYIEQAPVVLELTRESFEGNYRVLITNMMSTDKDFLKNYEMVKDEDKIITKKEENTPPPPTFWEKVKSFIPGTAEPQTEPTEPTEPQEETPVADTVKSPQENSEESTLLEKIIANWR